MESHIRISCPLRVREAFVYAENNNCAAAFATGWARLMSLMGSFAPGENPEGHVLFGEVWADWAPYSFAWGVKRLHRDDLITTGQFMLVGGLIYHGPRDGDGGFGNLAVSLTRLAAGPDRVPHEWTIHT